MATIPPWLNASPELFLSAARSGASVGSDIASRRQQSAMAQAQMEQQMNLANMNAEQEMNSLLARVMANREEQAARESESALDRALKERELGIRESQIQSEAVPLDLRELRDPLSGNVLGHAFGRTVRWNPEEIPTEGTPMVDAQGNIVANRFGNRVINIPRDRPLSQAEVDLEMMRMIPGGAPTNAVPTQAPMVESEKVTVVSPQGRIGTIPRSNLQRALQNGYRLQQ